MAEKLPLCRKNKTCYFSFNPNFIVATLTDDSRSVGL